MFKVGDSVVSASNGICKINDMVELDASGNNAMKMYFVLEPVGEKRQSSKKSLKICITEGWRGWLRERKAQLSMKNIIIDYINGNEKKQVF